MKSIVNLAFYNFVSLDPESAQKHVLAMAQAHTIKGTILIADEGINAMVAGTEDDCARFEADLKVWNPTFNSVRFKRSWCEQMPFKRLKVKVKPEIVTLRAGDVDVALTAPHLPPETFRDWLRADEDMVVIDTRNDFEFRLGTFKGSINPKTTAFHAFPAYVQAHRDQWRGRKVVMFCTGGIRCEKATSWMAQVGIEDVFQIEGGVLNYFEQIEDAHKDWEGELFVFDERVSVDTNLCETGTKLDPMTGRRIERNLSVVE